MPNYHQGLYLHPLHSAVGLHQSLSGLLLFLSASGFLHSKERRNYLVNTFLYIYISSQGFFHRKYFMLLVSSPGLTFKALSAAFLASLAAASAALIASVMFL